MNALGQRVMVTRPGNLGNGWRSIGADDLTLTLEPQLRLTPPTDSMIESVTTSPHLEARARKSGDDILIDRQPTGVIIKPLKMNKGYLEQTLGGNCRFALRSQRQSLVTGLSWRTVGQARNQPAAVVALDERSNGAA